MGAQQVIQVATEDALETVRMLCREFVAWQIETFPERADAIRAYFEPTAYEATLAALSEEFYPPNGAIFLAHANGMPVGCVMIHDTGDTKAEVKRLFLRPEARGLGIGKALVSEAIEYARQAGMTEIYLDTAVFLEAAVGLYQAMGFVDDGNRAEQFPPETRPLLVFLHRPV